jgi:DNA mismatch repair protein MutL
MEPTIRILPESVANQIAAGEVVQRPASVVKELMENAIDAGATRIEVRLKDAGKTLIQVIDNGKGMSPVDARLAFERHATSKLSKADDLFHIRTMGFRGEALASIAAVSQVELVTRRAEDELAWKIELAGSSVTGEEPTLAAQGSRFSVHHLFYNIPARRKFLADNNREFKYIRDEFIQIALVYPQLQFLLLHNEEEIYHLMPSVLKQRILDLFGKRSGGQLHRQLYPVEVATQLITISGFVGDPAAAVQRDPMQYFFVNGRFIRHKFFRSAVLKAYENLLPASSLPTYFLYFEVDPEMLDVNIHPTKTEVKFEHEQAIWPIIHALVREALGKFNAIPSLDFDREGAPEIQVFTNDRQVQPPKVTYNPSYNPFNLSSKTNTANWETLYREFHQATDKGPSSETNSWTDKLEEEKGLLQEDIYENIDPDAPIFHLFKSYILLLQPQSLVLIDQHRAHVRVLYDAYLKQLTWHKVSSQTTLFPVRLHVDTAQLMDLKSVEGILNQLGFQFDWGQGEEVFIISYPVQEQEIDQESMILRLIADLRENPLMESENRASQVALRLANMNGIPYGQVLNQEAMQDLVLRWTASAEPKRTPDGKPVCRFFYPDDLSKLVDRP